MTLSPIKDHCRAAAALTVVLIASFASPACSPRVPQTQMVSVAAAADLQFALEDLVRDFRGTHPSADIRVVYGSSGNFYEQIRNQAPFDVFLSADVDYPRRLIQEGLAQSDSLFIYGVGRIVIWAPATSPLEVERLGMGALEAPSVRHIAIANPEHAPYGRAAAAALKSLGLYDRVAKKLVLGENIAQTLQFVQSGAADVGIVALSLAMAPSVRSQGRYWEVPLTAYPAIEQGGVILARAQRSQPALDLRAYLVSPVAKNRLKQFGFYLPQDAASADKH